MKLKQMLHILLLIPLVSGFGSFHPAKKSTGALQAILTGPGGKAAASREEDIALTLQIIMSHDDRSTTVTKDQCVQQMSEPSKSPTEEEADVSIPYDAAAKLAYEASDRSLGYDDFKAKYLEDAVALVKSKQPIDVSIPYDATVKLAYDVSDKSMAYDDFKAKYLADAVALVKSKQAVVEEEEEKEEVPPVVKEEEAPKPAIINEDISQVTTVYKGHVKWFDSKKGFGFIQRDDDEEDFFVHQTALQAQGFRTVDDGAEVEFQVEMADNGRSNAVCVTGPGGQPLKRGFAYKKRED